MSFEKYLPELIENNIITREIAQDIFQYFDNKKKLTGNKLLMMFALIGGLLVGLGIILLIAHNWDYLPKYSKLIFAFLPVLISQGIGLYAIMRKEPSRILNETISILQLFAVGGSISMISQIYQIQGEVYSYLLTWSFASIITIFIYNSSFTAILLTLGITIYAMDYGYWNFPGGEPYYYWILLAAIFYHFYQKQKASERGNFTLILGLTITLSITAVFGTISSGNHEFLFWSYLLLFSIFLTVSYFDKFIGKGFSYSLKYVGYFGIIVMLLIISHDDIWDVFEIEKYNFATLYTTNLISIYILLISQITLFFIKTKFDLLKNINYYELVPIISIPLFLIGIYWDMGAIMANILVLFLGIITIMYGNREDKLLIMNLGMLIIALLITNRFFDTDMTFLQRGLSFISVGIGFFLTNLIIIRRRKRNVQ